VACGAFALRAIFLWVSITMPALRADAYVGAWYFCGNWWEMIYFCEIDNVIHSDVMVGLYFFLKSCLNASVYM